MSTPIRTPRAPAGAASGSKPPSQRSRTMQLVVIAVAAGLLVLATAAFTYRADEGVEGGTLNTARTIALTFTPDNGWKITGYDVTLTRQGAEVEGSTTGTAKK